MSGEHDRAARPRDESPLGRAEVAIVVLAVLGGVALRVWAPSPLWLDEALSVHIAKLPLGDIPAALRQDGHPPLYYALLKGAMSLAGDSDGAVRGLSAIAGTLLLPLSWALGRELGGPRAGRLALALTAASPFVIRYSTETRMYALVMLLAAAGALLVRRGLREPRPRTLVALAAVTAALLLSHYWALWLGAATAIVLVVVARRSADHRRAALRLLGAMAVGSLAFVPWVPSFFQQVAHTGTPWAPPTRPTVMVAVTVADLGGGFVRDAELVGMMLVGLVVLGLFARPLDRRRMELDLRSVPGVRGEAVVVVLTMTLGGVIGFVGSSAYASRYASVVVPLVLVIAAIGLTRIPWGALRDAIAAALVVGGLAIAAVNGADDRTQAGDHAAAIVAASEPGDLVVACPDQLGPSLRRELPEGIEMVVYPTLGDGRRVIWTDYAQRNAAADPAAVAQEIEAMLSAQSAVFVSWNGNYRTLVGQCEALVSALQARRPVRTDLVPADAGVYESGTLTWLRAAAG